MNETPPPAPTASDFAAALSKAQADMLAGLGKLAGTVGTVAAPDLTAQAVRSGPDGVSVEPAPRLGLPFPPRPPALTLSGVAAGASLAGLAGPLAFVERMTAQARQEAELAALGWNQPGDLANLGALAAMTGRPVAALARAVSPETLRRAVADPARFRSAVQGRLSHGSAQARMSEEAGRVAAVLSGVRIPAARDDAPRAPRKGKHKGPSHPALKRRR